MADDITWDIIHHPDLRDGIVAYYKLNDEYIIRAGYVGRDFVVPPHHGESFGPPADGGAGILDDVCELFNGSTTYIDVDDDAVFNTANVSVAVWAKLTNIGGSGITYAVSKMTDRSGNPWDDLQWALEFDRATDNWTFTVGGAAAVSSAVAVGIGTTNWMHVVGTYDGTTCKIYIDGELVDSAEDGAGDIDPKDFPIVIAARANGVSPYASRLGQLAGRLCELGIWDRALTDSEIKLIYNEGNGRYFDMLTAGWWQMDGSTDELTISGPEAIKFDPQKNTNDFTMMTYCRPAVNWGNRGLFCKSTNVSPDWGYVMAFSGEQAAFQFSKNGTTNHGLLQILLTGAFEDKDAFVCGRYDFDTDGTSSQWLQYEDLTDSDVGDRGGPVHSDEDIPLTLLRNPPTGRFFGRIYWTAYWTRKLSDAEVLQIRNGEKTPWELRADLYIDYHQAVGATYTSELPQSVNAWTFAIGGSPLKKGSTQITLPNPLGLVSVEALDPTDLSDVGFRTEAPLASSTERGVVYPQPEPEMVNSFSRTEQQVESARHRGLAPIVEHDRKKGR